MDTVVFVLVYFVLFGAIGMLIGQKKGRTFAGLVWSMLLGPFGWLLVGLGPTIERKAPPARPRALR